MLRFFTVDSLVRNHDGSRVESLVASGWAEAYAVCKVLEQYPFGHDRVLALLQAWYPDSPTPVEILREDVYGTSNRPPMDEWSVCVRDPRKAERNLWWLRAVDEEHATAIARRFAALLGYRTAVYAPHFKGHAAMWQPGQAEPEMP